jgi:hypothetical protein
MQILSLIGDIYEKKVCSDAIDDQVCLCVCIFRQFTYSFIIYDSIYMIVYVYIIVYVCTIYITYTIIYTIYMVYMVDKIYYIHYHIYHIYGIYDRQDILHTLSGAKQAGGHLGVHS